VRNCRALRLALRHCRLGAAVPRYLSNSTMGTQPGTMVPYLSTMILEQGTRSTYKGHNQDVASHTDRIVAASCAAPSTRSRSS
jgi:hypothetical protein